MQSRCSLCSRDFHQGELRNSPLPGGTGKDLLCQSCWQVLCPHPWPLEGSVHGGSNAMASTHLNQQNGGANGAPGSYPSSGGWDGSHHGANGIGPQRLSKRSQSMNAFNVYGTSPAPIRSARPNGWQPASMPETQRVLLSHSGDGDRNWGGAFLGGGSAPLQNPILGGGNGPQQHQIEGRQHGPPSFSPFELRNMMDEESLELFESQSHLLDPESRAALQRQRQYLQWQQNSVDEPGPMQSVLERQESAGSGCHEPSGSPPDHQHNNQSGNGVVSSAPPTVESLIKETETLRGQLTIAARDREMLIGKIQALEQEVDAFRQKARCRICQKTARNCVVLPCLHFTTCDGCFKRHCATAPRCPACNNSVTGFQTLLMLD